MRGRWLSAIWRNACARDHASAPGDPTSCPRFRVPIDGFRCGRHLVTSTQGEGFSLLPRTSSVTRQPVRRRLGAAAAALVLLATGLSVLGTAAPAFAAGCRAAPYSEDWIGLHDPFMVHD